MSVASKSGKAIPQAFGPSRRVNSEGATDTLEPRVVVPANPMARTCAGMSIHKRKSTSSWTSVWRFAIEPSSEQWGNGAPR